MKNCGSQPTQWKKARHQFMMYLLELGCVWSTTHLSIASNLVSTLVCYPIFGWCCSTRLIPDTWGFLMGVCSVMVLWLVLHGATTKPRASCGARHKVVLLNTCRYQGLLVMIHYGATPMRYLLVNPSLDIIPYLIRRSVPQTKRLEFG
jgi:hypothetical protein